MEEDKKIEKIVNEVQRNFNMDELPEIDFAIEVAKRYAATMGWISVNDEPMPRGETFILVSHKYGVDYIYFGSGEWRLCYSGKEVDADMLKNITHWFKPQKYGRD